MPQEHDNVKVHRSKKNTTVDIEDITPETAEALILNIHEKTFFNMEVCCRGLKHIVTPSKIEFECQP